MKAVLILFQGVFEMMDATKSTIETLETLNAEEFSLTYDLSVGRVVAQEAVVFGLMGKHDLVFGKSWLDGVVAMFALASPNAFWVPRCMILAGKNTLRFFTWLCCFKIRGYNPPVYA